MLLPIFLKIDIKSASWTKFCFYITTVRHFGCCLESNHLFWFPILLWSRVCPHPVLRWQHLRCCASGMHDALGLGAGPTPSLLQLQVWVSSCRQSGVRLIHFFFSNFIIFHQYSVTKIHFYHTILQDSIRRHPGL